MNKSNIIPFAQARERARQTFDTAVGLMAKLEAFHHNPENHVGDTTIDIIREALPGLDAEAYARLSVELGAEAFEAERVSRAAAMESLVRAEQGDVLKLIFFKMWEAPKPRLVLGCLMLSIGIKPLGVASGRDLAKMQNVSPEHVSNLVQEWQQLLGLPKTDFQKSEQAVQAAKLHNRTNQTAAEAA